MLDFFAELKRRHIYRVAAAYAVMAWVLIQLVSNVSPMLRLPDWAGTFVLVLLFVGFPVALLFAWIHQLAPESGALANVTTGKLDWFLAGALAVVIALLSYQQFAPVPGARTAVQPQAGVAAARSASLNPGSAISIAVMPFANVSADPSQDFFSDGMTDEIAGALAKVPDLRVVARSSAFKFKRQNEEARIMGHALGATHLIEGSVRQAGNRVRISAQLIQAENGLQIWSENYDRDLTDIFAIQEDIARAITASLRMPLGLKPGENLVNNRTRNEASYEDYLRAKALIRARGAEPVAAAVKLLEESVARDPDFAPAWGLLGTAYRFMPRFDPVRQSGASEQARPLVETSLAKAEAAARHAIRLDPKNADGYDALGEVQRQQGRYVSGVDFVLRALALDPDNPDILNGYAIALADLGYLKQAIGVHQRLQAVEPYVPVFSFNLSTIMWADGQTDAALAMNKTPAVAGRSVTLAVVYASQGRYGEAADQLQSVRNRTNDAVLSGQLEAAARLLRTAPAAAASPQTLPRLGALGWVYLYVGAPERAMEYHEGNLKIGFHGGMEVVPLWAPSYAPVRKTERFKAYVRATGYVDYWRAKGWPDLCHPVGATDFACE